MTVHHIAKSAIHVMCFVLWATAIFCSSTHPIEAFTPAPRLTTRQQSIYILNQRHEQTRLSLINTGVASLLAGSVGGAIGVGVAYPFDTIKTKAQVYSQSQRQQYPPQKILQQQHMSNSTTIATSVLERHPGTVHPPHSNQYLPIESPEDDLISLIRLILQLEGISGFFGGVRAMMIGQAIIKSVAFGANEFMLGILNSNAVDGGDEVSFATLLIAASFSGFVTSFLVAPVERVKVMMQAQKTQIYTNELECVQVVLRNEGWTGLFSRGLGPTLAREVPSYAIYFVVYGVLMQSELRENLGSVAPLIFGAVSGCACWIPVYPIDVVKTLVQNTEGGEDANSINVAIQLYNEEGIGAFFNGLTPKMIRASVNHSVTFWVYDLMMKALV